MKSGFKDPIAIKTQKPISKPKNGSNWNFTCPQYDDRTGSSINAGTHYGVGHKQPVGKSGNPAKTVPVLPMGKVKTMKDDSKG